MKIIYQILILSFLIFKNIYGNVVSESSPKVALKGINFTIIFNGKFSKNISSSNSISKLLKLLERKKLIHQKYFIKVTKNIPQKSGLGGGSMNAANILRYFIIYQSHLIRFNYLHQHQSLAS